MMCRRYSHTHRSARASSCCALYYEVDEDMRYWDGNDGNGGRNTDGSADNAAGGTAYGAASRVVRRDNRGTSIRHCSRTSVVVRFRMERRDNLQGKREKGERVCELYRFYNRSIAPTPIHIIVTTRSKASCIVCIILSPRLSKKTPRCGSG